MRSSKFLTRLIPSGVLLVLGAAACDSVLDIESPTMRAAEAGAGGEPAASGGSASTTPTPQAGEGGRGEGASSPGGTAGSGGAGAAGESGSGGESGSPNPAECEESTTRCAGDSQKSPEICQNGHWVHNEAQAAADCPLFCATGICTECVNDEKRCAVCSEGDPNCSPNLPQKCVDGFWQNDGSECEHYCSAGHCESPPSCNAAAGGRAVCADESCCRSLRVEGGEFKRDYDGGDYFNDPSYPAKVSSFLLDKFEVNVGRMKAFVTAFDNLDLKEGQGKASHIVGDTGWSTSLELPKDSTELKSVLKCPNTTWVDEEDNLHLPVNCVSFNVAYAFCIWDGGRLPTELEWNYAAAGGSEQRAYPWKAPPVGPAITTEYAVYAKDKPALVGSTPKGNGRWGQADLAGNVAEWLLDYHQDYPSVCNDCFNGAAAADRTYRGGAYDVVADELLWVSVRGYGEPTETTPWRGFRCARDIE